MDGDIRYYRVRQVKMESGEELPILIRSNTGLPVTLALRWVMRKRRNEVTASTIANDLYGLSDLLSWGDDFFKRAPSLEEFLSEGGQLTPSELDSILAFVRETKFSVCGTEKYREIGTASQRIQSIEAFLSWVAYPYGRGRRSGGSYIAPTELASYRERIAATFRPLRKAGTHSQRPEPLDPERDAKLRRIFSPVRSPDGRLLKPLRFRENNPFHSTTQLRAWLIYSFFRGLGLRRGEALKIKVRDIHFVDRARVEIRRRPDDPDDPRMPEPKVKGMEGYAYLYPSLVFGLKSYLTDYDHPGYRKRGRSDYLLLTRNGSPVASSYCNQMFTTVARSHPELRGVSPHVLRHTWAEELASHLLQDPGNEKPDSKNLAIDILREAGRWSPTSSMPLHYIQNALRRRAYQVNREITDRIYHRM
jgi:integrase